MDIKFNNKEQEAQAFDKENQKIGYCQFEIKDENTWAITHTVVDNGHQGEGIAGKLLDNVCENAKKENVKIIPVCSYAVKKFDDNPEKYGDLDAR